MTQVLESDAPRAVAKLQRALQNNHAAHVVLRQAAIDFFEDVRRHGGKNVAKRERLLEAFKSHFRIDAPTEYGMHGILEKWFPATYTCTVGTAVLQNFTIRAWLKGEGWYDFIFTL